MIDDKQTCDVCGEEFNEDRPHPHTDPKKEGEETPEEDAPGVA
ncbi:MAG: hypothetical protein WC787_00255 [Patescibacteria group bacterium]|jgi:hypothetical protein